MKPKVIRFLLMVLLAIFAIGPMLATAQDSAGKIVGVVRDPQGAVITGAKVTVTNVGTAIAHQTTTDTDGAYQVLNLPIGTYRVTAEHFGFQKVNTTAYDLQINATLKVDISMRVGTAAETVEVTGNASLVETQNATVGSSVTSRPIVDLPLNGRNVLDLATLEPGVAQQNPGNAAAGTYSISGSRTDSVTYLLDGGSNNNLLNNAVVFNPNPDTIAEFKILESNYGAEFGRNAGGIISVVTKSGTNALHGTAYEFLRNDALDANRFFNKVNGLERPTLERNQFGGTLGGPIKKDKFFFFTSYEGQRRTEGIAGGSFEAFTPAMLNGDFSGTSAKSSVASFLALNPYYQPDPAKAALGIIDPTRIDTAAKKFIAAGLIPSSSTGVVSTQANQKSNFDEFTGKLDYNFSPTDRLNGTLGFTRAPGDRPYAGGASVPFPVNDLNKTYFLNLAYNKSFSPTVLNELRFTAQRFNNAEGAPAKKLPSGPDLGVAITPDLAAGPPIIYFLNSGLLTGFSYRGPVTKVNNTFGLNEVLSWVKGHHTLKFGFGWSPYQNNMQYAYEVNGEFDYDGSVTGSEFADFLVGAPYEYIQSSNAKSNIRTQNYSGFWQDDWRVKNNLTLSFGLRYEYSTPKRDTMGRTFSFVPGQQSTVFPGAPIGLLFPGDKGAPDGSNFPDRNDFAPRFGFAWDPKGDGKMSIRGGVGVFYDILKGEDNLQFNGQAPWNGFADFNPDPCAMFILSTDVCDSQPETSVASRYMVDPFGSTGNVNTFPSRPPDKNISFRDAGFLPFGGSSVYFVDPHLRTPYVYHYNLSIQRQLAKNMRIDVAYVGSTAHKLTALVDNNPFVPGTSTRIQNLQVPGQYSKSFSYMDTFKNVGYQNYNSLQTSLKKQMSGEGTKWGASYFTLAYTWAKNIDTASGFRQGSTRVKYFSPGADRSVSDLDVAHTVVFSGGWDLPIHELIGGPRKLTKGWTVNPIISARSGFPIDIRAFLSRSRTSPGPSGAGDQGLVRPNLVGTSVQTLDPHKDVNLNGALYFSPSNFNTDYPADGFSYGTLPRNFFRGPGRTNVDVSIAKVTPITERVKFEFRTEFFNLFNNAQFMNPTNLNPNNPDSFGRITDTYDPRQMQFGFKVVF